MNPTLSPQQQTDYYRTQGSAANPLSPTAWLAQQTNTFTTPSGAQVNATSGALVAPPPSTTINASNLGNHPLVFPPTPQPDLPAFPQPSINEQAASFAQATQPTAPTAAEQAMTSAQSTWQKLSEKMFGKAAAQTAAETTQGISTKTQAVTDLQSQINQLQNEATQQTLALEGQGRGITQTILNRQSAGIERERTIKALQLNSFLYAAQGNLATAQDMADKAVKAEFDPIEAQIKFTRDWIDMNKDNLSREDKKRTEALTLQLNERDRLLGEQKATKTAIQNIGMEAARNHADATTLRNIQNATSPEGAIAAASGFLSTKDLQFVSGTENQPAGYFNKTTGKFTPLGGSSQPGSINTSSQKSLDQLSFLRNAAKEALKLADASGPSGISRFIGDTFVGDTKFRQLEAQTNTLRTNVLTLMTDPGVKKFFGPQMSNADVTLMTAAGTTLNPTQNSPAQMKEEIKRLDNLFNRIETSIKSGQAAGGTLITAPNGEQVIITD